VPAEKSLASELAEIRDDLKLFVQTRVQLFRMELKEKARAWKGSLVLLAVAAVFLLSSWLSFVFALVALVRALIASTGYGWFAGGLIVAGFFLLVGGICGMAGYQGIKASGVKPARTLRVLRQDQQWIQKQARPA
jgi:uncharacterized membrane protein YqjE